jgi:hypothetical protein
MEKPKVLYHASPNKDLSKLEPRSISRPLDFHEGQVVFATPDLSRSTVFLVASDDSWTHSGSFGNVCYFYCKDKERFLREDHGGVVYFLPPDTFEKYNENEWFSKEVVTPIEIKEYTSGLTAMVENGVRVYFVDDATFERLNQAEDHGLSILSELETENEKRDIPVKDFNYHRK